MRGASVISACVNPLSRPPAAERVLILRLGAVGDVVRTLPAVSALRAGYAGAHLTWLVEPASQGAVAGQPWVDEVLVFPRGEIVALARRGRWLAATRVLSQCVRALRRRRFDLVIDFHGIAKSAALAFASGAPQRIGYAAPHAREGSWLLATGRARLGAATLSRFERNLGLAAFVLGAPHADARPWRVDAAARARMAAALGDGPAPIALQPGTSAGTPHKRWASERYADLARRLRDEAGAICIVLHGTEPGERALAESIAAASDGAARVAPATASLGELAALLERARLYIGGDTGPMHVASLVGTPVVQILGPTDPVENAPWGQTASRSVRRPVACSPCRRGCAAATCMQRVEVDDVAQAALGLLAGHQTRC